MSNELIDTIWIEKYRASSFDELVFEHKDSIINYLKKPKEIPSFLFYSASPGTGKSSLAKLIAKVLDADILNLNASKERGIDTIREEIGQFVESLSTNPNSKRIVFLDEADGLTPTALNSLRNLMEEFADNVFFIYTANDLQKIIEPIRSRCVLFNFDKPSKKEILARLVYICEKEAIEYDVEDLSNLINLYYPDIRSMIKTLQSIKTDGKTIAVEETNYTEFIKSLKLNDIQAIYSKVYSGSFNILACNRYMFKYFLEHYQEIPKEKLNKIVFLLADTEKYYNLGVNLPIVFIANCLQIGAQL